MAYIHSDQISHASIREHLTYVQIQQLDQLYNIINASSTSVSARPESSDSRRRSVCRRCATAPVVPERPPRSSSHMRMHAVGAVRYRPGTVRD